MASLFDADTGNQLGAGHNQVEKGRIGGGYSGSQDNGSS
jgi:hypothetical protein